MEVPSLSVREEDISNDIYQNVYIYSIEDMDRLSVISFRREVQLDIHSYISYRERSEHVCHRLN